jgi:hypothetical protein
MASAATVPVVDQAKKRGWARKREQYRAKASDAYIERHAARHAERPAMIEDKALDLIDQALDKLRDDMRAVKLVRQPEGSIPRSPRGE